MYKTVFPNEWKSVKLKDIARPIKKKVGDKTIETLSISAGIGFVNQAEKFGKELSGSQYEHYTVLNHGDFSYNKGNSKRYPQRCVYQLKDREQAAVPNVFISFSINNQSEDFYEQLFIGGYLNSQLKQIITSGARSDGLLNVSDTDFFDCIIPLPPLVEQRAIADILSTADYAISLRERLIAAKQKQKRWLMQNLLTGKMRLPGFSGEWESLKFGALCKVISGSTKSTNNTGLFPLYGSTGQIGFTENADYIGKYILIARVGANAGFVYQVDDKCGISDNTLIIEIIDSQIVFDYFFSILNSINLNKLIYGTGQPLVTSSMIKSMKHSFPPLPEQRDIAEVLTTADKEIELLQRELEQQKLVKKYLMQQLLTGRTRVKEAAQ